MPNFNPAELESQRLKSGPGVDARQPWNVFAANYRMTENYYSDISVLTTAASPVTLFVVTGLVEVKLVGTSEGTALTSTSDTGTLAVGITGATTLFLGTTTINQTNFPSGGAIWVDTSPTVHGEALVSANLTGALIDSNIILTIATNNMLTGSLRFCCMWRPWSSNGAVVSAR